MFLLSLESYIAAARRMLKGGNFYKWLSEGQGCHDTNVTVGPITMVVPWFSTPLLLE